MPASPVAIKTWIDNGTTAVSATVDKPPYVQNGTVMIATVSLIRAVATITWGTPPSGWTLITNVDLNPAHAATWFKVVTDAGSEPSSYTFPWTGGGRVVASIIAIDGANVSASPIDGFNTANATSNGSDTSSYSTTEDDVLVLKLHTNDNAGGVTIVNPTGWTPVLNHQSGTGAASAEQGISYKVQDVAGSTGTVSWSMSASEQWIGITIGIKSAAGSSAAAVSNSIRNVNVPFVFSRDVSTIDEKGVAVSRNQVRFGKEIAYMPALEWEVLMAIPGTDAAFRSSGVDHDGHTPLSVWYRSSSNTWYFLRGTTIVRSWATDDIMDGDLGTTTYKPTPGVFIYNGAIIMQCERLVSGVIKGVGLAISQDCGLTFERIEAVGGGDLPIISGDVSSGKERGHRYSISGAYPYSVGSENTDVFIPVADYIAKTSSPQGGQLFLFRMTRSAIGDQWTVQNVREIYQFWEVGASGNGTHMHTGAVCPEGLISHSGDVDYRNRSWIHLLDLSDYQNAAIDTHEVYGGYSDVNTVYRTAPQPVCAMPGAVFGTHIAAGDESSPAVGLYTWDAINNCLLVQTLAEQIKNSLSGTTYDGANELRGYMLGTKRIVSPFYSSNGVVWAKHEGSIFFYDHSRFLRSNSGNVEVARIPSISAVRPVCIRPGGRNILDQLTQIAAPTAGVTVQAVYWDSETTTWRYVSGDGALDPQPPASVFPEGTLFRQFSTTGGRGAGGYTLSSAVCDSTKNIAFNVYAFNMAKSPGLEVTLGQGFSLTAQCGTTGFVDTEKGVLTSDNQGWIDCSEIADPTSRQASAARWVGYIGASSSNNYPSNNVLVAFVGVADKDSVSYPIRAGSIENNPDEQLYFSLESSAQWSVSAVFVYPESCKGVVDATNGYSRVFCTIVENATNMVKISLTAVTTVRFAVTIAGVTDNVDVTVDAIDYGDVVEVFVSCDGVNVDCYARSGKQSGFATDTTVGEFSPTSIQIGDYNFSYVQDIKLLGLFYWPEEKDISIAYHPLNSRSRKTFFASSPYRPILRK